MKRPPVVAVLGHVDHGKCVVGETLIPLADGNILSAKEIFENYSKGLKAQNLPGGQCLKLKKSFKIFSFDGSIILHRPVSHLWKLDSPRSLIKILLYSGDQVLTTPEHPFFVFTSGGKIIQKPANNLKAEEFVIVPKNLSISPINLRNIKIGILIKLVIGGNWVVFLDGKESKKFWQRLSRLKINKFIKEKLFTTDARTQLNCKRLRVGDYINLGTYLNFTYDELYDFITSIKNSSSKWRAGHTSYRISIPKTEADLSKLSYVLGCIVGDGSFDDNNVYLHNNDLGVYKVFRHYLEDIFGVTTQTKHGHTALLTKTNGGKTLKRFISEIFEIPTHQKSAKLRIPLLVTKSIFMSREFIAGFFDTDGYVSGINHSAEFTSKSEMLLKQVATLLLYFGIHSTIYHKKGYTYLRIANKPYLEIFLKQFNLRLSHKKKRIKEALNKSSISRIFDYTPLSSRTLSNIKVDNQIIPFWDKYKKTKGFLTRPFLQRLFSLGLLYFPSQMRAVLNTDVSPVRVRKVEEIKAKDKFVYDFTVPKTHNFVAERIVMHNTTLLDAIRKTNVAEREVGQITQSIGASEVIVPFEGEKRKITFIDTPGHEAFLQMRSHGISASDLAILALAANEGVKPQTRESIKHIKEAKIPLIVVLTKSDLPNINELKVKQQLVKEGISLEGLGGNVPSLSVSAKLGRGIKELLDLILLVWEMQDQEEVEKLSQDKLEAVVIESKLDHQKGILVTLVIKRGTLKLRDEVFAGAIPAKIRAIFNNQGLRLKQASPGEAVEVLGFSSLPSPGEIVKQTPQGMAVFEKKVITRGILPLILKAESLGALEAILGLLPKEVVVVSKGSGEVNESDILLAKAQKGLVVAFNVKVRAEVLKLAQIEGVIIKQYHLIYELLDEVKEVVESLESGRELPGETVLGRATVLASFPYEKTQVLGVRVLEGRMALGDKVKLLRDEEEMGRGTIKSLKKKKEDVKAVQKGEECGIILEPSLDFKLSDVLLSYRR